MQGTHRPDTLSEGQVHKGEHSTVGPELPKAIPPGSSRSTRTQVSLSEPFGRVGHQMMMMMIRFCISEEHILSMIAKITSPIPGPSSSSHRPRRKTLRGVACGVVFIQRIKCVSFAVPFLESSSSRDGKARKRELARPMCAETCHQSCARRRASSKKEADKTVIILYSLY